MTSKRRTGTATAKKRAGHVRHSIAYSGWAEYAGGGGYQRAYWDASDAEFEIGDVEESSETVHDWRHPDGGRPPLGPLPFRPEELSPPDALEDLEPDELDLQMNKKLLTLHGLKFNPFSPEVQASVPVRP